MLEVDSTIQKLPPSKGRVLVVDDEEDIVEVIGYNLSREGYNVDRAYTGEEALERVNSQRPDLILLDLMLPGIDGLDVCRSIKRSDEYSAIPIIMLSARGEEMDVVMGLEIGADDYITKPFSQRVLQARIKSALRRRVEPPPTEDAVVQIHNIAIHPGRHEVFLNGEKIDLTPTEFRLLHVLSRKAGWVFTRYQIVEAVRGEDFAVTARSVDVQIVGLRRKLGDSADLIETVRGVGYRMKDPNA